MDISCECDASAGHLRQLRHSAGDILPDFRGGRNRVHAGTQAARAGVEASGGIAVDVDARKQLRLRRGGCFAPAMFFDA